MGINWKGMVPDSFRKAVVPLPPEPPPKPITVVKKPLSAAEHDQIESVKYFFKTRRTK